MKNCIFCKIIKKEIPAKIHYEDKDIIVIKDANPKAPIHLLIIPKIHFKSLNEIKSKNQKLLGKLLLTAQKISRKEKFDQNGYKIIINTGENAGQSVEHLHLHLLSGDYKKSGQI
ncbi:MAG: histidine triad nucleotide-binding protein [Patescibacteria group bacterium]|nr:histidine triad nucleotide-binding protein [Patescibacteria group bacterium]